MAFLLIVLAINTSWITKEQVDPNHCTWEATKVATLKEYVDKS